MSGSELATKEKELSQGQLLLNESLADYTTWRVGGKAAKLYKPAGVADLSSFLATLSANEPLLWLGLGSNTLIKDKGFRGNFDPKPLE